MATKSNTAVEPDFLRTLIGFVLGVLILVATAAFVFIPYSLSGNPGEVAVRNANTTPYHPT